VATLTSEVNYDHRRLRLLIKLLGVFKDPFDFDNTEFILKASYNRIFLTFLKQVFNFVVFFFCSVD
jgi:hypothetical protein